MKTYGLITEVLQETRDNFEKAKWISMPTPENCRNIRAPEEAGLYQVRNKITGEYIQFGIGKRCQIRMQSLYPAPYGKGNRNKAEKREYVLANWKELEYRTVATKSKEEAQALETEIKRKKYHKFNT